MNLVIHIGRHKSGTTSLQHWLQSNSKNLRRAGFLYPASGLDNQQGAHHDLSHALNDRFVDSEKVNNIALGIRREAADAHTVIISSEGLQNISRVEPIMDFLSVLGIPKARTKVICYLREHLDYAMSAYRQEIHEHTSIIPFYEFTKFYSDLAPFFSMWKEVGCLELSWFSRNLLAGGNIVEDFCRRIGVTADNYLIPNKNFSIGGNLLAIKLAANKLGLGNLSYAKVASLAEEFSRFSKPFYLDDRWCENIRANSSYNRSIILETGLNPDYNTWSHFEKLPEISCLKEDAEIFCERLAISDVKSIYKIAFDSCSYFATS